MKIELLLLCSVCYWFAVPHGHCSEQTLSSRHHEKHTDKQLVIDSNEVESLSPSRIPVSGGPHMSGSSLCVSCRDCAASDSCSAERLTTGTSTAECDAAEDLPFDTTLPSFPAVQENASVRETGKPGKRSNASLVQKEQASTETDPSVPSKDQEIPTFDEWTKIMMETEKSQVVPHAPDGKKLQQTVTNYASVECGAKILSSNPEAKSTSAILMENMDMYMLNPCNNKIWFIIELCQPIQVKQLDIANFEIFSSNPKDFLVSISDRYPNKKWVKLGTFHARDERTVQSFPLDEHLFAKFVKMFTRYIKVELLSHFGSEHFCPLSLIRVFGTSMMEEYELNSEPSDRPMHSHDEQDYDQPPDFVPVDDKPSTNLIGSAKDALFTMVNNIAANVLGGHPEGAGNSSTEGLNGSEVVLAAGAMHSGPEADVARTTKTGSITSATHTDAPHSDDGPVRPEPDPEQVVTLLPEAEDESDQSSEVETDQQNRSVNANAAYSETLDFSLHDYLLQRCSSLQKRKTVSRSHSGSAVITSSMSTITEDTESAVNPTHVLPAPEARSELQSIAWDLASSLTSDLQVSTERLSIELMCVSVGECLTATLPPQSTDHLMESSKSPDPVTPSDLATSSSGDYPEMISATSGLENDNPTISISTVHESQPTSGSALVGESASVTLTPAEAGHPSDGFVESVEAKSKELVDNESSANVEQPPSELDGDMLGSSEVPVHGSSQKESVFMRLNNRIKALEMNMSLSGRYLEQLSQRYRKQVEEMQKAFNKTIIKLQNTSRTAEEQDQRQTDSIQVLQTQLENVTQLVLGLSVSVSRLQQEVSDRQSYILLCLILCVLLALLICVNYRQMCESPALDTQRSCYPERELTDEEPVIMRRRASDPPSLSSLQMPEGGSEETSCRKQWQQCPNKHKLKLGRSPEARNSLLVTGVIPQSTIGPQALEVRDVMSDGSEGSSHSDETLFCGFTSCARLCETIPAPRRWTQSKRQKTSKQLHQPPQRRDPYNLPQGLNRTGPTDPPLLRILLHWSCLHCSNTEC